MRRLLIAVLASLLAVALIPPAAQAATQVRQVQVPMRDVLGIPPNQAPPGALTLDFVFKNTRSNKKRFTPRQLIKVDLSNVPLTCQNGHTEAYSRLLFTETFETKIKLRKIPIAHPKPGRYAFRFAPYSFPTFNGTIQGTIDKSIEAPKPRLSSQGHLNILDLDADPGHLDCTNWPPVGGAWGGLPVTAP